MGKFFKGLFTGLGIGIAVALGLYALGFVVELLNCACGILACDFDKDDLLPFMWRGDTFFTLLVICAAGGTLIGAIVGAIKGAQEKNARDYEEGQRNYKSISERTSGVSSDVTGLRNRIASQLSGVKKLETQERLSCETVVKECIAAITAAEQLSKLRK